MSYRTVIAWEKGMNLVVEIYKLTEILPTAEKYGLVTQMQRAATSIPSNIAEGYGRGSKLDYARFTDIALGSVRELQTQLEICQRLGFAETMKQITQADEVARIIYGLGRSLRANK